jgi:hypothetical protein
MTETITKLLFRSILCLNCACLCAQSNDTFVLQGIIIDRESGEPLPYASLAILHSSFGTIANDQGEFRLAIVEELLDDTLVFSFVGYARQSKLLSELKASNAIKILLVQQPTMLNEISVESGHLDANQIMEKAVSAIKQNYPSSPFRLEGFFRELTREETTYVDLTEAVIRVFDKNFQRRLNQGITEEVSILQGRNSVSYADPIVQQVRKQNSIMDLLDNNPVHYTRGLLNTKYFDYKLDSILETADNIIYIISTIPGRHQIYVADSSYAILKTIEEIVPTDTLKRPEFNINDSLVVRRMAYFKAITEFQTFNGKMYLKYSNETDAYEILYRSTRKRKFLVESFKEMVVTHISDNSVSPFLKNEKYNFRDDIVTKPYDHSFWKNNPNAQLSPLTPAVLRDLGQKQSLENQFEGRALEK